MTHKYRRHGIVIHHYKKQPVQMLPAQRPPFELYNNLACNKQPKQDACVQLHTRWFGLKGHMQRHTERRESPETSCEMGK